MANLLEHKIDGVRRRARWLLLVYGVCWVVAVALGAVGAVSLVDYLFKFDDHGVRLIFSLGVLAAIVWAAYRFLWQHLHRQLSDVALAQRIERQFPQLKDRLSTAVAFLKQPEADVLAGSVALRQAVITSTTAVAEPLDFQQVVEPRPARTAVAVAGVLTLAALVLAVLDPQAVRVALVRLTQPFGTETWPRRTHLEIVGEPPTRLAVGQTFELNVRDHDGRLPDEAQIHFRFSTPEGEGWESQRSEPMLQLNDTLVARLENVSRPFSYRVTGGDDNTMPWITLDVVEPPRVESLKIALQPPGYTGWPVITSDRQIQALRGTQVELKATATKKLKSARLVRDQGEPIGGQISADGYAVRVPAEGAEPFVVDQSTAYWLELVDEQGITGGTQDRWEIRAVTDSAPTVVIELPNSNQFVTTDAEIPLRVLAKDDLAIRDVQLHYSRSTEGGVEDFSQELFRGPAVPLAKPGQTTAVPREGDTQVVTSLWKLAPLELKPGMQITFYASASDYLPQSGKSAERKITIITPRELEDRIAQRQAVILSELTRILALQRDARVQINDLEVQQQKVGALGKQDIDHAQGAELNQRMVRATLTSEEQGLPVQIGDLLAELKANKVDSPDIERRMQSILGELQRLGVEHLTPLESDLTGLIKRAQMALEKPDDQPAAAKDLAGLLKSTATHQDEVITSLERMIGELAQWDSYRRFGREIRQFKADQEELQQQAAALGAETLGRAMKDLEPQQRADLAKLAERQRDLARRFDKARQQMADMAQSLDDSDPLAAAALRDAAAHAGERGVSGKISEAGRQLDDNQVGQAQTLQQQVGREMDELLDILANRREQELSRLVSKLREAEEQLAQLRSKQAGLKKQMAEAGKQPPSEQQRRQLQRLAREQKQLEEEAARFARRLQRLQAEKAGRSTQSAAGKMSQAGKSGEQGDGLQAGNEAEQAEKDLEEAQQQLAERRRQAEMDLAREQIARLQDGLKNLAGQQEALLVETQRLEELKQSQGRLTRAQIISVRDLARAQRALEAETRGTAEKVAAAEVFFRALEAVSDAMRRAALGMERQETGASVQRVEADALRRINQLLDALKTAQQQGEGGNSGGEGGGNNEALQDSIRALAEVKLLKLMQEDLNDRFQQLARARSKGLTPEQLEELEQLAAEQGRLADLMQNFTRPPEDLPEDDPERLPDLQFEETP